MVIHNQQVNTTIVTKQKFWVFGLLVLGQLRGSSDPSHPTVQRTSAVSLPGPRAHLPSPKAGGGTRARGGRAGCHPHDGVRLGATSVKPTLMAHTFERPESKHLNATLSSPSLGGGTRHPALDSSVCSML